MGDNLKGGYIGDCIGESDRWGGLVGVYTTAPMGSTLESPT